MWCQILAAFAMQTRTLVTTWPTVLQVGSALSLLPGSRSTQLDDFSEYVYDDKYGAWMPGDANPDEWAKENLAAPPPPPKTASKAESGPGGSTPAKAPLERDDAGRASAPQTPLPGNDGPAAPATGGRFSARSTASRKTTRSRYVDTFNPEGDAPQTSDRDLMPPPPARPKPAPAYKIFTPQKPADEDEPKG